MPRQATIRYSSLRSSLVKLPLSLYAPLLEHQVRPQSVAVHLSAIINGKRVTAHLGWSGLASASSLAQWQQRAAPSSSREASFETVEVDPQLASSLGFPEHTVVDIGLLHDLPVAQRVFAEPLSSDDWEIMELHANYMEESLLSQVRVAVVGQEVDAWVLGRTRVRFKIVSIEPDKGPSLLSTDTEVAIAPKTRNVVAAAASHAKRKRSNASQVDSRRSQATSAVSKSASRLEPLRVLPASLLHDFAAPKVTLSTMLVSPAYSFSGVEDGAVVRVQPQRPAFVRKKDLKVDQTPTSEETAHKVIRPSNGTPQPATAKADATAPKWHLARLQVHRQVPDGHAVSLGVPAVDDWDIVTINPTTPEDGDLAPAIQWPIDATLPPVTLAGVSYLLDEAITVLANTLTVQGTCSNRTLPAGTSGLLMLGRPGSGRTSVSNAIAGRLQRDQRFYARTIYKDMGSLAEDRIATIKDEWMTMLDRAAWASPAVILLDNLDTLVGAELEHADSSRQRQLAEHFISVFGRNGRKAPGVVLLATAKSTASLHPLLLSSAAHIFTSTKTLMPPNRDARRDIVAELVKQHITHSDLELDMGDPINYVALATTTEGYGAADLKNLVAGAVGLAAMRETPALGARDLEQAQRDFVPLSLRDVQQGKRAEVRWSDIGGLHETRRVLRETLEWPTKYGAIFAQSPLRLRSGLLLYGYPGCGKTLLASAVARECGLNFISVKGPELLNKYIGASEQSVRELFERATAAKPCVLFFDEFDSIAPKRGHDSTGVTDRVVNQLLTQMDGAEGLDGVYVLAATSRPDLIDPALLRPGRLDKALLCGMPEEQERLEILQVVAKKIAVDADVDLTNYATRTDGFTSADLQALLYNANLDAIHENIADRPTEPNGRGDKSAFEGLLKVTSLGGPNTSAQSRAEDQALQRRMEAMLASTRSKRKQAKVADAVAEKPKVEVHDGHLSQALRGMKPSLPADERFRLALIYDNFQSDRSGRLPAPNSDSSVGQRTSLM